MTDEMPRQLQKRIPHMSLLRELLRKNAPPFSVTDTLSETDQQVGVPDFAWFIPEWLAALAYPQSTATFLAIREMGLSALLNLSETPLPASILKNVGLRAEHIPIVGFTAPSVRQTKQALTTIDACLEHDMTVGVVGMVQASVIFACYLVEQGMLAYTACDIVRQWRADSLVSTMQQAAVFRYAAALT